MQVHRMAFSLLKAKLSTFPVVALIGPRQVGKTTLALEYTKSIPSQYLDLESPSDLSKLDDAEKYFSYHNDKLIVLDEIHHAPDIFKVLRSVVDKRRREGKETAQFLILGSASIGLLKQASETLAGRIDFIEMSPLSLLELNGTSIPIEQLWLRGGYPSSLLAQSSEKSLMWRSAFIKTYLERDITQFGPRIPIETLRRFWTMIANSQGSLFNASRLASNFGITGQTITRYLELFVDLFLVRRLQGWHKNEGKRLVRAPKIFIRDSGLLHALLGIDSFERLQGHPIVGASWESFVLDNILSTLPESSTPYFYRTARGAEIDLIIEQPGGKLIAIEIKHSSIPKLQRGFFEGCKDINPCERYVIHTGSDSYPMSNGVTALPLEEMLKKLS